MNMAKNEEQQLAKMKNDVQKAIDDAGARLSKIEAQLTVIAQYLDRVLPRGAGRPQTVTKVLTSILAKAGH